jgi:hypothetical protein
MDHGIRFQENFFPKIIKKFLQTRPPKTWAPRLFSCFTCTTCFNLQLGSLRALLYYYCTFSDHNINPWSTFHEKRFGQNLRIKCNLVKFKFVIVTLFGFKIP